MLKLFYYNLISLAKKNNLEFLPIVERERVSLLIGNFYCCSFDTVKFNIENNKSLCLVA
jgi:hypothetical protein